MSSIPQGPSADFLYSDRPLDVKGAMDLYWAPAMPETCALSKPDDTAALAVRRRVCRCSACIEELPGLYRAQDGSDFPRGARINKPGEQDDQWPDAPTDIALDRLEIIHAGLFQNPASQTGILFPTEFTTLRTPKVITLHCTQRNMPWFFGRKEFQDFIDCYRFRTDNPNIEVGFFWADKKAHVSQSGDSVTVKLIMNFPTVFNGRPGDKARLILERRLDAEGNYHDIACLPDAITLGRLSDFPQLERFFGKPDWQLGDLGLFIEKTENLAVFRLPKSRRAALRSWLDQPIIDGIDLGVNSRESALIVALLGLWYIDDKYGKEIDEFFASPVRFIKEKRDKYVEKKMDKMKEKILEPYEEKLKRTAYGAALRSMDSETREAWIGLRKEAMHDYGRVMAIMNILEKIKEILPVVMEAFRIARFTESVLRSDTLYSSTDEYLFISFLLDPATHVPNGIVCPNLIPLGIAAKVYVALQGAANQILFWESADAYYLDLLNVDKHVRNYAAAKAKEETEGKEKCFICHGDDTDAKCSVCGQKYHLSCFASFLEIILGPDCPRCMQRGTVAVADK